MATQASRSNNSAIVSRLRRGSMWIVLGRTLGMAIVFGNLALLAKLLPDSDFSAYVVTISIVTLSSVGAMVGMNYLICRLVSSYHAHGDHGNATRALRKVLLLGTCSSALVAIGVSTLCYYFAESWFERVMISEMAPWIGAWVFLLAMGQIIAETYRGLHNLFAASLLAGVSGGLAANGLILVGMLICHQWFELDYVMVVQIGTIAFLAPVAISFLILLVVWPNYGRNLAEPEKVEQQPAIRYAEVLFQAIPIMLLNFVALGFDRSGQLFAGSFGTELDVSIFEATWQLAFLAMVPLTMLGLSIASTISELHTTNDTRAMERVSKFAATVSLIVSTPVVLVLLFFGGPILGLIFEESFAAGAASLCVLCVVQLARNWMGPCDVILVMTGKQVYAIGCFIAALPILALAPWSISMGGLFGLTLVIASAILISRTLQYLVVVFQLGFNPHAELNSAFLGQLTALIRGKQRVGLIE